MATPLFPARDAPRSTEEDRFLDAAAREHATTLLLLQAFPAGQLDL